MSATVLVARSAKKPLPSGAQTPAAVLREFDEATWSQIFNDNYSLIYRYAYARLGSREDAEEIASQVFLEALRSINQYKPTNKPILAWLYGIARNLVANSIRRRQRAKTAYEKAMCGVLLFQPGELPIERLDLSRALSRLNRDQREVLLLRFTVGLSTRELCVALGRSPGAVYSLQIRALAALRRILAS
jgi:RNA polymerase sigma-70 factor (ECF subfamily)